MQTCKPTCQRGRHQKRLNHLRPIYGKINDPGLTWELTNKADALKKAAK